ncbi:MAG: tetratricopeptide repeat protein [Candidatus Hodarchaeota archaeon]
MSFEKARALREAGNYPEALELLNSCLATLPSEERYERIACLNEQSQCFWRTGRLTEAENAAREALRLADDFPPDLRGKGAALANLGYVSAEKDELGRAEKFFEQTLLLFEQIGTLQEISGVLKALEIVNRNRQQQTQADAYLNRFLIVQEQIERESLQAPKTQATSNDLSNIFLLVIRMMQLGPDVFLSQELPFAKKDLEKFYLEVGIYYTTALGQGGSFHQGLYGPLPLTSDFSSLVYARVLPDRTQIDPRMPGKTYAIFCVGYPKGQESIFADRKTLNEVFEERTSKLSDISEISLSFLDDIRKALF